MVERSDYILYYFIAGMLFATLIMPFLDGLLSLFLTWIEVIKGKMTLKISKYNYQISQIGDESIQDKHIIGFITKEEEDETDEETL